MRRTLTCLAAASLLSAAPLSAQQNCPNAAVNLLQAIHILELHESTGGFRKIDWSEAGAHATWKALPKNFKETFDAIPAQAVQLALDAKQMDCCNFQLPKELGPHLIIPHLRGTRQLASIVRLHARGRLIEGDVNAAAASIAAMYRIADGLAQDRIIISSLVAIGIANWAAQEVDVLLATSELTPAARQQLVAALDRLGDDPFGFRATLEGEQEWIINWLRREFRGEDAGKRLAKAAGEFAVDPIYQQFLLPMFSMQEHDIIAHSERLAGFFTEAADAWDKPDAVSRLMDLEARLTQGEFGVLAPFAPVLHQPRKSADQGMRNLQRIRNALHVE